MRQLGIELTGEYEGRTPLLVAPLKASLVFVTDLSRALAVAHELDFLELAPYDAAGPGIRLLKDLDAEIEDRNVVIVEDVVDTGLSLNFLC